LQTKQLKVFFDHQIFCLQRVGGISRYYSELIKNLPQHNCSTIITDFFSENIFLNKNKNFSIPFLPSKLQGRVNELMSRRYSNSFLRNGTYDVFHPTYYSSYHLGKNKKPFVISVYDMIHEIYPHQYRNPGEIQRNKKKLIHSADKIIAISDHTKSDILKFNDVNPEKIEVIYLATSIREMAALAVNSLNRPFILFVGERKGYKNFKALAEAFSQANLPSDVVLFCGGGGVFSSDEMKFLVELGIDRRVFQKNLSDGELAWAYQNALCFVFPSLYEGFGIPILESMTFGTPTILSDKSCFPEIAREGALYFKSTPDLAELLVAVVRREMPLDELKIKALRRSEFFSWDKVARQTSEVYRSLI
jgi:glycosyltransferase involved in cell wall biosynthesis